MNIVFIHGLLGNPSEFFHIASLINQKVQLISLPYHGCSEAIIDFSSINDWLEEQLLNLKVHNCIIYGYSMGGRLALHYALTQTKPKVKIEGIIIESSNIGIADHNERKARHSDELKWIDLFSSEKDYYSVLNQWYSQKLFFSLSESQKKELIEKRVNSTNRRFISQAIERLAVSKMPYLGSYLKDTTIPMLYLFGEYDIKYKNIAEKISKLNPNIIIKEISSSSHNCHYEQPKLVAKEIIEFIGK